MMPLGAPSISKYGSLVRPDAQIVALRAHCARTARALRLRLPHWLHHPCLLGVPMVGRNRHRKRVDVVKMSKKCVVEMGETR